MHLVLDAHLQRSQGVGRLVADEHPRDAQLAAVGPGGLQERGGAQGDGLVVAAGDDHAVGDLQRVGLALELRIEGQQHVAGPGVRPAAGNLRAGDNRDLAGQHTGQRRQVHVLGHDAGVGSERQLALAQLQRFRPGNEVQPFPAAFARRAHAGGAQQGHSAESAQHFLAPSANAWRVCSSVSPHVSSGQLSLATITVHGPASASPALTVITVPSNMPARQTSQIHIIELSLQATASPQAAMNRKDTPLSVSREQAASQSLACGDLSPLFLRGGTAVLRWKPRAERPWSPRMPEKFKKTGRCLTRPK